MMMISEWIGEGWMRHQGHSLEIILCKYKKNSL